MGDLDMPTLSSSVGDLRSSIMRLKISLGPNKAIPLVHIERVRSMRAMLQTLVNASRSGNWVHSAMANDFVRGLQALEELEKQEGAEDGGAYEDEEGGYGGDSFVGRSYGRGSRSSSSNAVTDALLMAQHSLALLVVHYSSSLQQELSSCQERLAQAEAALSQVQTDKSELLARYAAQGTQLSELMEMESLLSGALSSSQAMVASLTGTGTPMSIREGGTPLKTVGGYISASLPATPTLSPIPSSALHTTPQIDAANNTHTSHIPSLSPTPMPAHSTPAQIDAAGHAHMSPTQTHSSSMLERRNASSNQLEYQGAISSMPKRHGASSSGNNQVSSRLSSPCCQSAPASTGVTDAMCLHQHQQQQQQQHEQMLQGSGPMSSPLTPLSAKQIAEAEPGAAAAAAATAAAAAADEGLVAPGKSVPTKVMSEDVPSSTASNTPATPSATPTTNFQNLFFSATDDAPSSTASNTRAAPLAPTTAAETSANPATASNTPELQTNATTSNKPTTASAPTTAAQAAGAAPASASTFRPLALFSFPAEKAADSILARTAAKGMPPSPQETSSTAAAQHGNSRAGSRGHEPGVSCVSERELRLLQLLLGIVQLDRCIGQVLNGSWGIICAAWSMAWNTSQLVAGAVWPWTLLRRFI